MIKAALFREHLTHLLSLKAHMVVASIDAAACRTPQDYKAAREAANAFEAAHRDFLLAYTPKPKGD